MLIRQAPAKINLGLAVHRRRRDAYHDISTIFLKISLTDILSLEEIPQEIVVQCDHPEVPSDERNLVYRAAAMLWPYATGRGVRLHLQKHIPVAAGLGGGSSDAAATLLGLNTLWDLHLSRSDLMHTAARLGADVPFFLLPTEAALGRGRGDVLEPLRCPQDVFVVVVNPRIAVSTAWAYQQLRFELTERVNNTNILKQHLESGDFASLGKACFNDLEEVVVPRFPEVQEVKHVLARPGVYGVSMSGSGPTVYGLCASRGVVEEVVAAVRRRAWDVWVCQPWHDLTLDTS